MSRYRMVPSEHIIVAVERTLEDGRVYHQETIFNAVHVDAGNFPEGFLMTAVELLRKKVAEKVAA